MKNQSNPPTTVRASRISPAGTVVDTATSAIANSARPTGKTALLCRCHAPHTAPEGS